MCLGDIVMAKHNIELMNDGGYATKCKDCQKIFPRLDESKSDECTGNTKWREEDHKRLQKYIIDGRKEKDVLKENTNEKAIAIIERAQATHIKWANYLRNNPEFDDTHVGSSEHHIKYIEDYEIVLSCLGKED